MKRNFHIKLGKFLAVLAMLLIGGQAWGESYTVCSAGCTKTTPQLAFDEIAMNSGDMLTITGNYSAATLDLSGVAETGIVYVGGTFKLGKIIGKAGLSLVGNGTTIRQASIELGNNANLQGFKLIYEAAVASASYILLIDGASKFLLINGSDKLIRP